MDPKDKDILRKNRVFMMENLEVTYFMSHLIQVSSLCIYIGHLIIFNIYSTYEFAMYNFFIGPGAVL